MADGIDVTRAEFEYAVTHEGALTVDDILDRRTRIGLVAADRAAAAGVAEEFLARAGWVSVERPSTPGRRRVHAICVCSA